MKKQLQPATLTEVLAGLKDDNDRGITFIVTGSKEEFLSYNELYHSALLWLGHLQEKGMQPGDELVLQVDDNRLFLPIFWACILGGIIAVPVSVTHYSENINKLFAIRQCLNNPGFISPASHYEKLLAYDHGNGSGIKQSFHTTLFTEDKHSNKKGKIHQVTSSDIAFIQFSSGSTGHPKGVVLTHKNLITNMYSAITAHQCKGADRHLSWMPLTHDMGLIGFHLYPMAAGVNHYLMPTELFIRNPLLWMQKVSEHNVTITCSPNFGYHYYLNHFTDDKAEGMDLSSLRIILNGAEPVSAALCRTFMKKMGNYHLCSTAMCPGYGLAEATLEVTFSGIREPLKSIFINRTQLTIGSAVIKKENEKDAPVKDAIEVVDLGKSISGVELKITDSEGKKLKDGYIGIIWIKGDAVTKQYYNNKPITKKIIQRGWLNTGDTGFMISGHLYVVGRVKDIIFINGANIYPHDIEQVLEQLPDIGTGKVVACGIPDSNTGSEAIAVFIVHRSSIENFLPLIAKVKKYIATRMGLEVKQVLPIKKMVKTTSGKVRRHFFAEEYDKGTYNTVIGEIDALTNKNKGFSQSQCSSELNGNKEIIRKWITNWLQKQLDLQPHELQAERTFAEYGVTSMQGIAMASALEEALQTPLEYTAIYNFPTIPALTDHVFHTMDSLAETGGAREETGDNRIAIIGIGCRFPGKVNTPEAFWSLLKEQKNAITIIPEERWDIDSYFDKDENVLGKMYTRHGGFIEHATEFDPLFFGISPKEAACMDPQHRLLLEISWEALEQARLIPSQLKGSDSGIFIGMGSDDYQQLIRQAKDPSYFDDAFSSLGLERSIAAGRLAYFLDFHGPVVQLDTACSSSLLSVHQACQSLLSGECNLALAGGVNLMLSPETTIKLCRMNALSPEGLCKTFDDHADGYVRGEGAGMVVLKRLSDAIKNNDPIQAVICGSAVNHDGLSNGLTAPNGAAQQALIKKALRNAGLDNKEIQYVEAHGTGTRLGDPIEVQTLNAVYGHSRNMDQPLILGAVKTNIGHLEAAAGIASLIKTVLCLQHKQIPGNLNYHKPNSFVPWDTMPLKVANSLMDWKNGSVKRRGAVSAFGLSGTNVHMILEEFPKPEISDRRIYSSWPSYPFCLSAKTEEGLKALAKEYSTLLHQTKELMADISYSTVTTRQAFQYRLAMEAGSAADALQGLQSYLSGSGKKEIKYGSVSMQQQKLVWLFTGQGSQYWNMGKELYENNTVFKQVMDRCNAYLQDHLEVPLNTVLYETDEEKSDALLQQTCYTQPALFAVECALAEVWKSWGIVPSMVAGHSVGEYAAAYIAGVFDLEEGLKLIAERARLMQAIKTPGKMIAVFAEEARVIQWISAYGKSISIAAKNGPELIVVSGEQEAMLDLRNTLTQAGIKTKELPVSHAFHSSLMNPVVKEFRKIAERISFRTPTIPIISNLTGEIVTVEIAHADYWCKHITEPVLFSKSIETITASGGELLLELGPQAHLSGMAQLTRDYETGNVLVSMKKGYSSWSSMLEALMSFYIKGISINWDGVYFPMDFRKVQLPVYPFQRQHYWIKQDKLKPAVNAQQNNQEMTANTTTKITTTDIVSDLAAIFSDLLKLPVTAINIHTRFMELGADSLVLLNVIRRIERKYRLNFSVRQVFEEINTLDIMARYIAQHTASTAPPIKVDLFRASSSITEISSKDSSSAHSSKTDPSSLIQRQLDIMEQQLKLLSQFGNGKDPGKHSGSSSQVLHEQRSRINPVLPKKALKNGNGAVHRNGQPIFPKIETRQSSDFTAGQQAYLDNFIKRYTEKTKTSKALAQQYRPVLADNRASAGFRFSTKELVYPIQALSCKGSKLRDVDGNEYIDLAMGFGVNLLGHSPESITKALQQKLQQGYLLGPQTPLAGEVAELLTELTGMERVSFHNSGTEAVMTSIRLARTVTGKNKIAVFSGSYHGHFDGTLAIAEDLAATHAGIPMTPGILHNMVADVLIFDYTDPAVIQQIQGHFLQQWKLISRKWRSIV